MMILPKNRLAIAIQIRQYYELEPQTRLSDKSGLFAEESINQSFDSIPGRQFMPPVIQENAPSSSAPPFRLDQKLHQILYKPEERTVLAELSEPSDLPEPPYPIHADPQPMSKSDYQKLNAIRAWKTWGAPYFKSRWYSNDLRPIIPYLFTEWKCLRMAA